MGDLLHRDPAAPQPGLAAGVRVDGKMRAVDARGRAVLANVFCCGAVVGGYDAARQEGGLGVAAVTAVVAARAAAEVCS